MKSASLRTLFILLSVIFFLALSGCVVNVKPHWSIIPDQIVLTGQELILQLDNYVSDRDGNVIRFLLVEGPGEIKDRLYYCKLTDNLLEGLFSKTFRVRIRAVDNLGATSDVVFQLTVIKSSKVTRLPDVHVTVGQSIVMDLKEYLKLEGDLTVEKVSDVGTLADGVFSFKPNSPGTYQCVFLVRKQGLVLGYQLLNIFVYEHLLTLNVSEYNSGPAVEGALIQLFNHLGEKVGETYTSTEGKACFDIIPHRVVITKPGYATTTIYFAGPVFPIVLDTTLRKYKFSNLHSNITVDYELSDVTGHPLKRDSQGIYEVDYTTSTTVKVKANAHSDAFEINHMYLKLGSPPGAEFFASPRIYTPGPTMNAEIELSSFSGIVPLFIEAYDANDNRYTVVVPIKIIRSWNSLGNYYIVEKPGGFALKSFTIRQDVRYYSKSVGNEYRPLGAPQGMNLYVEVSWKKWEESVQFGTSAKPVAYKIYRSVDGLNFFPVATVPASLSTFRDGSPSLFPGKRVWYAVSSVYEFGESPRTVLGSVVPLPMVYISDVRPTDNATGVSCKPVFSWRFTGLEDYKEKITYYYDLWLYDTIVDKKYYEAFVGDKSIFTTTSETVTVPFDELVWKRPNGEVLSELAVGRPYEWGLELMAAEWKDVKNSSISISLNCDYNSKFGVYQIPPERYYLFVTGGK